MSEFASEPPQAAGLAAAGEGGAGRSRFPLVVPYVTPGGGNGDGKSGQHVDERHEGHEEERRSPRRAIAYELHQERHEQQHGQGMVDDRSIAGAGGLDYFAAQGDQGQRQQQVWSGEKPLCAGQQGPLEQHAIEVAGAGHHDRVVSQENEQQQGNASDQLHEYVFVECKRAATIHHRSPVYQESKRVG